MRYLTALVLTLSAALASAQPSPIGPPPNHTDKGSVLIPLLTNVMRSRAQTTVDETNARLRAQGKSTRVSIESLSVNRPSRSSEVMPNQPNSWFVRVPHVLTIKVAIPHAFDRHIHIPIGLNVFCNNWYTKAGTVIVRSEPGPASIEGGSILEDIISVRDDIDARVRSSFTPPLPATATVGGRCSSIGFSDGGTTAVNDDVILWDVPPPASAADDFIVKPTIEVTFERLKRLRARGRGDQILYKDQEDISLHAFANYTEAQKTLSMREGDDVALNMAPIRLDARKFENLVIIGSVEQPPNNPKDSVFAAATKAQGYAPGSHKLQIPKWFSIPPDQFSHKPQLIPVPAYELTYTVRFHDPSILLH